MVVLPLLYVALIVAAGFLVFKHATVNAGPIFDTGNWRAIVIGYFGPLVIGARTGLTEPSSAPRMSPGRTPASVWICMDFLPRKADVISLSERGLLSNLGRGDGERCKGRVTPVGVE
jgi:hypothetical protein